MGKPLNPKQAKFVALYLESGNATEAYIKAGYICRGDDARSAAQQVLTNINVKAAIDAANTKATQTAELTAEWVIKGLKKEAEREGDGAQHTARIKAYELLGKALKMWGDEGADGAKALGELVRSLIRGRTTDRGRTDRGPVGQSGEVGASGPTAPVAEPAAHPAD